MGLIRFRDREEAGESLAGLLAAVPLADPLVLALPRGGVPVAVPIARRLAAPLDLVMVRKIGVPGQPELAAAAVAESDPPVILVNEGIAAMADLDRDAIDALARVQLEEIARRRAAWLGGRPPAPVAGRDAILVDDGIATGATMRAALTAVRRAGPAKLVLAVPVAAEEALQELAPLADAIVCIQRSLPFGAVGASYRDFAQLEDGTVRHLLDAARLPASGGA